MNRMRKLLLATLYVAIFSCGSLSTAQAALESRLSGDAYYDTDLNVTWTTDANINGSHGWSEQMAWASGLSIGGIGGWRLPEIDELEHLMFVHLGIATGEPIVLFPFINLQLEYYWSSTAYGDYHLSFTPSPVGADMGFEALAPDNYNSYAWAVHSGDVALIPEPQAYIMLMIGLGLLGFVRKRNA